MKSLSWYVSKYNVQYLTMFISSDQNISQSWFSHSCCSKNYQSWTWILTFINVCLKAWVDEKNNENNFFHHFYSWDQWPELFLKFSNQQYVLSHFLKLISFVVSMCHTHIHRTCEVLLYSASNLDVCRIRNLNDLLKLKKVTSLYRSWR